MSHVYTEEEIRQSITKSSTQVLISEALVAQNTIEETTIKKLSRELLLKLVISFRKHANQILPVKILLQDYKIEDDLLQKIKKFLDDLLIAESTQSDVMKMMFAWMQNQEKEREKEREIRKTERAEEQKRLDVREANMQKQRALDLIEEQKRLDAREAEEQKRLDAREAEVQKRQDERLVEKL